MKHEIFLGVVAPIGTPTAHFLGILEECLSGADYKLSRHKLSAQIPELLKLIGKFDPADFDEGVSKFDHVKNHMEGSRAISEALSHETAILDLTIAPITEMRAKATSEANGSNDAERTRPVPLPGVAHVFLTLKRPEEVDALRELYGDAFFLIGLHSSVDDRERFLVDHDGMDPEGAKELMTLDLDTDAGLNQGTRDAFEMADVFLASTGKHVETMARRFAHLLLGDPFVTPTREEHGMFTAYATAARSMSLSRQVGAAAFDQNDDVIAVGYNDVAKPGGGLYNHESENDGRDLNSGYDANDVHKRELAIEIANAIKRAGDVDTDKQTLVDAINGTRLKALTEFGRDVHAEMELICSAARQGRSLRGSTMYVTTFPCHNCAKHIVASGIECVIFVEPYPKSQTPRLFPDSISVDVDTSEKEKVRFSPFYGVSARRYLDLFSMKDGGGGRTVRKAKGKVKLWDHSEAALRTPTVSEGYPVREMSRVAFLEKLLNDRNFHPPKSSITSDTD